MFSADLQWLASTVDYSMLKSASGRCEQRYSVTENDKYDSLMRQESHAVAGKPRDAAVNSDRYRVRWHFAGAISVSRMQSVSGCTVYA